MPLTKRLECEVLPEWRINSIPYKDLQREAEDLVGNENEELEQVFKFHLLHAAEEASAFYEAKQAQVEEQFEAVDKQIEVCAQVHIDRAARTPCTCTPSTSPTMSTDCLWSNWTPEEKSDAPHPLADFFEIWVHSTKEEKERGVIKLSDFVDDSFMSQLEEGALRGALKEWLRLLALIDQVRSFAALNVMAAVKVVQRHCAAPLAAELKTQLQALPMFAMAATGKVMADMEQTAKRLALCLAKDYAWSEHLDAAASHWSLHICPFCGCSVANGVVLQPGRPACWTCALAASQNAIVWCPLTGKDVDLRALKLERVLGNFLRRYFPCAHKTAPGALLGHFVKQVETPKAGHGILSMMQRSTSASRVPSVPEAAPPSSPKRKFKKRPAPPAMDLSYLDTAVSKMLERLGESQVDIETPLSSSASARHLGSDDGRRDRSSSLPCPPPPKELASLVRPRSSTNKAPPSPGAAAATPKGRAAAVRDLASLVTSVGS